MNLRLIDRAFKHTCFKWWPGFERYRINLSNFHPNFKPILKDFGFPKGTTAKISEVLTKKLFESLLGVRTKLGGQISHILNTAMKLGLNDDIGLYLTDADVDKIFYLQKFKNWFNSFLNNRLTTFLDLWLIVLI